MPSVHPVTAFKQAVVLLVALCHVLTLFVEGASQNGVAATAANPAPTTANAAANVSTIVPPVASVGTNHTDSILGTEAGTLTPVKLQLKWTHKFQFAGYYAAREFGIYEKFGLDVEFLEGGPFDSIQRVVDGEADYGVASMELVMRYLTGSPVVLLAPIFQESPEALIVLADPSIQKPSQLIGSSICGSLIREDTEILLMFLKQGVLPEQLNLVLEPVTVADFDELSYVNPQDPNCDAFSAYITTEPFAMQKRQVPFTVLKPSHFGVHFFGDCMFASKTEVQGNPEQAQAFLSASIIGWYYAIDHPDEIIDLIREKYNSGLSREFLEYEAARTIELINADFIEIGHFSEHRLRQTLDDITTHLPGLSQFSDQYKDFDTPQVKNRRERFAEDFLFQAPSQK